MRKNVHDFLENDVINDDQNDIPISQQMIENVNEDHGNIYDYNALETP